MFKLRNWLLGSLTCLGGYLALVAVFVLRDGSLLPRLWLLEDWWRSGGFVTLGAVAVGYIALQAIAQGRLSLHSLWQRGSVLMLLPFFMAGGCARNAYQNAAALGSFGPSTLKSVAVLEKEQGVGRYESGTGADRDYGYYDTFSIYFSSPRWGVVELERHDGSIVLADEVPVSEGIFKTIDVGSGIEVVELPGAGYPPWRLASDARAVVRSSLLGTTFWLVVSVPLVAWGVRRELASLPP